MADAIKELSTTAEQIRQSILQHNVGTANGTRQDFTNGLEAHFMALGWNMFACHPNHSIHAVDPANQPHIAHRHYEISNPWIGSTGFEVYVFPRGMKVVGTNLGDGGDTNWAYCGNVEVNGKTVVFN